MVTFSCSSLFICSSISLSLASFSSSSLSCISFSCFYTSSLFCWSAAAPAESAASYSLFASFIASSQSIISSGFTKGSV